jgi:D-alanyl-lipoteichoic acid acyltransferase DltB (MBOAT superfamily)
VIFHSLDFLVFFVIVLAAYWALPFRWQNGFLLAASWLFYGYVSPWFLGPLIVATFTDFTVAKALLRYPNRRKALVWVSLMVNLGMLGIFKYFNFFIENVNAILTAAGLHGMELGLSIILPVGISFYTLQSIGYTIDVYRGHVQPCRRFIDYALYVAFFPQLVAGPIERSTHLLPMICSARTIDSARILSGLQLMLWGFFKKLVIADNVAITANKVFAVDSPDGALLWAGVFAFAIQIFADFSAYTDIARGAARILGFELMENFRGPYLSQTPHEFWGRWHISLSSWIRDYVYIPLGGSRCGPSRNVINIIIAFAVSGLWHGAQWNFIFWGLYWSVLTLAYRFLGIRSTGPGSSFWAAIGIPVKVGILFLLTCFGWLLFRETNPQYLARYLTINPFAVTYEQAQVALFLVLHTLTFALPLLAYDLLSRLPRSMIERWNSAVVPRRLVELGVACALFLTILILRSPTQSEFIYFQF